MQKLLGFDVKASIKFTQTKQEYVVHVDGVEIQFMNNQLVPKLNLTYNIDSKFSSMLQMPYEIELDIREKNMFKEERSALKSTWVNTSFDSPFLRRESSLQNRAENMKICHQFFHKDGYALVNSEVFGTYEKKTLKAILNDLWGQTNHGSLQFDLGKLACGGDSAKLDQIGIPNMKFHQALNFLSQKLGFFEEIPILGVDKDKLICKSINDACKEKPITIELISGDGSETNINVDERRYTIIKFPTFNSNFQQMSGVIPKSFNTVKHSKKKLYEEEKIKTEDVLRSIKTVDTTDIYTKYLEKNADPKSYLVLPNNRTQNAKESIALLTGGTVEPITLNLKEPLRLDHFKLGTKVQMKTKQDVYMCDDISFYISGYTFALNKDSGKRWEGTVNLILQTASTRDILKQ
jgi:hypothetical protein